MTCAAPVAALQCTSATVTPPRRCSREKQWRSSVALPQPSGPT